MKYYVLSDLHLEGNHFIPLNKLEPADPEGTLLVAGDTFVSRLLKPTDFLTNPVCKPFIWFLNYAAGFKRAFFVLGNHEHYKGKFQESAALFKRALTAVNPEKLILLDNSIYQTEDAVIVGCTLWTDMNRNNPMDHQRVGNGMNDFRIIHYHDDLFSTHDAVKEHKYSKDYIAAIANNFAGKRIIVLTHHCPSFESNGAEHVQSPISAGYCSSIEDVILDNPNIDVWVHGHTHVNVDYMIGQCRVFANQMGYSYGYYMDSSAKAFLGAEAQPRYFEL